MNQLTLASLITPVATKYLRVLIVAFCAFLTGHDLGGASTLIASHSGEITTAIIGGFVTLLYHFWMAYKDTTFFVKAKALLGLSQDATHTEALAKTTAMMDIAVNGTGTDISPSKPGVSGSLPVASLAVLVALLTLPLGACSMSQEASVLAKSSFTAQKVVEVATAVPPNIKKELASLTAKFVTAHPSDAKYLDYVSNTLEGFATVDADLPDPNGTLGMLLKNYGGMIPEVGSYITDFIQFYSVAYPFLKSGGNTLTELGELIRSYDGARPGIVAIDPLATPSKLPTAP